MLFNSYGFIFIFLPFTLLIFYLITKIEYYNVAIAWLIGASLFFYSWWNPIYLLLILFSIFINYSISVKLGKSRLSKSKFLLIIGIVFNVFLLGYFKYVNFFINNINTLIKTDIHIGNVVLPLAISFFTLQQIAFLIDSYQREDTEYSFLQYCLFVTFFPQLVAGPIVYRGEMLPQFSKKSFFRFKKENIAIGQTIFIIGLFKKVVFADTLALISFPIFSSAELGNNLNFIDAWGGALAYTFQIYFDFSGYSDMAIGLARMFGFRLPLNFFSPYKATNIIEFWRCWHMTLSRFLREYLYIPLGGNRKGNVRRYSNLMITMLLGGLWHGAGWTFVIWGFLHGFYLILNHLWRQLRLLLGHDLKRTTLMGCWIGRAITFIAVVMAWVFFRADSFNSALIILKGMLGLNGFYLSSFIFQEINANFFNQHVFAIFIVLILFIVWGAPNTEQFMTRFSQSLNRLPYKDVCFYQWFCWQPNRLWAIMISVAAIVSVLSLSNISEYIYFQF